MVGCNVVENVEIAVREDRKSDAGSALCEQASALYSTPTRRAGSLDKDLAKRTAGTALWFYEDACRFG